MDKIFRADAINILYVMFYHTPLTEIQDFIIVERERIKTMCILESILNAVLNTKKRKLSSNWKHEITKVQPFAVCP